IALKVPRDCRDSLKSYLLKEPIINSVYRINNGYDFMIEAFFRNVNEVHEFVEGLERFRVKNPEEYYVLEEIKKEAFMSDPEIVRIFKG
ncbi:MAG: Lrp/AsnC family transcriptional regulator, partial [Candidatus Woesearchaeota archaeon]|nr:Lrp/AsnC family transcriptional regulator [Candidatus Woesearchaeota archaeon]